MSNQQIKTQSYLELSARTAFIQQIRGYLREHYESPPLACVHSYGCQQSVYDGERLKGLLADMGYGFTDQPQEADFILYNTCAVRENAEQRVLGNVGALKGLKRQKPQLLIGLSGCMTEQPHIVEKIKMSYPYVDLVIGTNAYGKLPELLYQIIVLGKRCVGKDKGDDLTLYEEVPVLHESEQKAFVPVMYGCDNFCSYCIVPYVRGRERSRLPEQVEAEVRALVQSGCRDITLLGQNVNSYGKGLPEPINFAGLLHRLDKIEGDFRIRFMTSHPKDCTKELIDAIAQCGKVCKHLHLPVQSGSDRILTAMNRHYTIGQYESLLQYARERIPELSVTSDIIVGFPGEEREDFDKTLELIQRVHYHSLFTFIYSKRSGTAAEKLTDPVASEEKSRWFRELLDIQGEIGNAILQGYVGKILRVLPEAKASSDGMLTCRSDDNTIVEIPGDAGLIGQFVFVKITEAMNWALKGEVIDQ